MTRLIVLRPLPGADATVEKARARGLEALAIPLFELEQLEWSIPDASGFDGLLLTSANAIRFGGEGLTQLRGLRVYAVGETTAEAARDAGFEVAAVGGSGVDRLLGSIEPGLKLLHLSGEDRREPTGAAHHITNVTVYRASVIEHPQLSAAAGAVALIHSPRAGRRFAALVSDRASLAIAAISEAAADAVGEGWRQLAVAESPTDDALLALAASLCEKPDPK